MANGSMAVSSLPPLPLARLRLSQNPNGVNFLIAPATAFWTPFTSWTLPLVIVFLFAVSAMLLSWLIRLPDTIGRLDSNPYRWTAFSRPFASFVCRLVPLPVVFTVTATQIYLGPLYLSISSTIIRRLYLLPRNANLRIVLWNLIGK